MTVSKEKYVEEIDWMLNAIEAAEKVLENRLIAMIYANGDAEAGAQAREIVLEYFSDYTKDDAPVDNVARILALSLARYYDYDN